MHGAQNLAVVRRLVEAVIRGDREGFLGCLTPEIEWDDREGWPGVRRVYHGLAGARTWFDAFVRAGGDIVSAEIEEIAEASESRVFVGVFGTFRGRPDVGYTEFNARAWYVIWLRDGKVARAQLFWVRREALEAAGLLEHDRQAP
jgi:ketosteroid isomerase-like protein